MPDLDSKCLIVKCLASENSSLEIKSYFQKEKNGGDCDVNGVIYPLNGDKTQAAVMFETADSVLSVCSRQHENYTVKPARMVFSRVEATISSHLWAAADDVSYYLDFIGVQTLSKSGDDRTLLGNLLQIVEAERILLSKLSQAEGSTEEDPLEALGPTDGLLPNAQPPSSPGHATSAGSRISKTGSLSEAGALQGNRFDKDTDSSRPHIYMNPPVLPMGQLCNLDGSLMQKESVMVSDKKSYQLYDMEVLVYEGDLTKLNVDAIVNPANERLSNGAGAARAIADAGGTDFQELCDDHVSQNGVLQTGHAVTLPATGKLKERGIRFVINCVGPQWHSSTTGGGCRAQLADTVVNCLQQADKYGCKTMAMPAISSGIFGVPMDICTAAYIDAISEYVTRCKSQQLKTIHLVNIDRPTCDKIAKAITDHLSQHASKVETAKQHKFHGSQESVGYEGEYWSVADRRLEHETAGGGRQSVYTGLAESLEQDTARGGKQPVSAGLVGSSGLASIGPQQDRQFPEKWWDTSSVPVIASGTSIANDGVGKAADSPAVLSPTSLKGPSYADAVKPSQASVTNECDDKCPICLDVIVSARKLPCGHTFCVPCIASQEQLNTAVCPVCRQTFGVLHGNQPKGGTMQHTVHRLTLPGYPGCGCIEIAYNIPSGIQDRSHPNPGKQFAGTRRTAYLPDNSDGRHVLDLLKKAFDQGLTFTVGTSHTTGYTDCVVWNDIHHKTSTTGGPTNYGYPDLDYLQRVKDDLAAKGIR